MNTRAKRHSNSVDYIVGRKMCCGCGICCLACPEECIENRFEERTGSWQPVIEVTRCMQCGLCLEVCPFAERDKREDIRVFEEQHPEEGKKYHENIGAFLNTFVGRAVSPYVEMGSSGGIGSALAEGWIEHENSSCIGVKQRRLDKHPLFETVRISDSVFVKELAGSKYYPVEFSKTLKAADEDAPILLFCLPCVAYALFRLRQKKPERYGQLVIVGLTCGHCPTALFTDFMRNRKEKAGSQVAFRDYKKTTDTYSNFSMQIRSDDSRGLNVRYQPFKNSLYGFTFVNWMFSMNACRFCDDTFGFFADITLMDAWLPEYTQNISGTSLVICRTQRGQEFLETAQRNGLIRLAPIAPGNVVQSQQGVLNKKTRQLSALLSLTGVKTPNVRHGVISVRLILREIRSVFRIWRAVKMCPLLYRMGLRSYTVPLLSLIAPMTLFRLLAKQAKRGLADNF